ncbi:hypothetical protein EDB83DRAFT_2524000 [Lactarius deliciosus]|nr:hypothetical protein EDB83DRAFT_2524000 [Lactarius deliciosus]
MSPIATPADLAPFIKAQFIRDHHAFRPWLRRFTQDNIRADQWDDMANVVIRSETEGPEMAILILLHELLLHYMPGDNIKHRWSESTGLVMTVDKQRNVLTYVKDGSTAQITTDLHDIDFFTPDLHFYPIRSGTWSEFNIRDLEICGTQGPLLPQPEGDHPLVGRRVKVTHGQFKGLKAIVKDVTSHNATVEFEARLVTSNSPNQIVPLLFVTLLLKEAEKDTPTNPASSITLTDNSTMLTFSEKGRWLLTADIQAALERRCIPFYVSGVRDGPLDEYEGKVVRTLRLAKRKLTPKPNEVVVSIYKRSSFKQISINVSFLQPWKLVINSEAVIIEGSACGTIGVVKGLTPEICSIGIEDSTGTSTQYFKPDTVVYVELLRK